MRGNSIAPFSQELPLHPAFTPAVAPFAAVVGGDGRNYHSLGPRL